MGIKFDISYNAYAPKSNNEIGYSLSNKAEYPLLYGYADGKRYDFLYEQAKRKLNYLFKYSLFPAYGSYIFLYDLSDSVRIEIENTLLKRITKTIQSEYSNTLLAKANMELGADDYSQLLKVPYARDISVNERRVLLSQTLANRDITEDILDGISNPTSLIRSYIHSITDESMSNANLFTVHCGNKDIGLNGQDEHLLVKHIFKNVLPEQAITPIFATDRKEVCRYFAEDVKLNKLVENLVINELVKGIEKEFNSPNKKILVDDTQRLTALLPSNFTNETDSEVVLKKTDLKAHIEPVISNIKKADKHIINAKHESLAKDVSYSANIQKGEEVSFTNESRYPISSESISNDTTLNRTVSKKNEFELFDSKDIQLNNNASEGFCNEFIHKDVSLTPHYAKGNVEVNNDLPLTKGNRNNLGVNVEQDKELSSVASKQIDVDQNKELNKAASKEVVIEENISQIAEGIKGTLTTEIDKQLNLHKRFWFVKQFGQVDYKILPNVDFDYPMTIEILEQKPNFNYYLEYEISYPAISGPLKIELYNKDYKLIQSIEQTISNGTHHSENIILRIDDTGIPLRKRFEIELSHRNIAYCIIRQPLDDKGMTVLYSSTETFLADKHPIPFGNDLGLTEIPIHIPIMVDFINVLLLMWSKFHMAFTGYTGKQAIYSLLNVVYEWVTLETSLQEDSIEDYHRCFRWLRWEAEKVYMMARHDMDLTGNAWVERLIYELIDYMESHHMDNMPTFEPIEKMDEYRNIFSDPSFDMDIVIDKVKGVRKLVLEKHKRNN